MNRQDKLIFYHDLLVIILVILVGASLFLTALFAIQVRTTSDLSEEERVSLRNQLVQLQLENRLRSSQQLLDDLIGQTGAEASPDDLAMLLSELNEASGQLTGTEWRLFDSVAGELLAETQGRLVSRPLDAPSLPWRSGALPDKFPFMTLYKETSGEVPRGVIVFGPESAITTRFYPLLLVNLESVLQLFRSEFSVPATVMVLDWAGNQLVEAHLSPTGASEIRADWFVRGVADPAKAPPYLGIMNLYLGQSPATQLSEVDDSIHSVIQVPIVDMAIVLHDQPVAPGGFTRHPSVLIALFGLALYALIMVLFVSYRRTVVGQTRKLNELSEQKNMLFSLLSHNLKNNLAAITAEAHGDAPNHRLHAPVADASRVISNSLYYLQFQEHTFEPPPLEAVLIDDLVEFLTLRCSGDAAAKSQTLRVGTTVEQSFIQTNLTLALEALERILVNAIQYSPGSSEISVDVVSHETTVAVIIADHGPGLPSATVDVYERPLHSPGAPGAPEALTGRNLRGIGVYVARKILTTLGAAVHLLETGATGTRVSIEFPRIAASWLTHGANALSIEE